VAQTLTDLGWDDVHYIAGGFDAWVDAGYPLQPK
jgi:rhodanese-related sulfurtransferase